jgi:hypothetical protein
MRSDPLARPRIAELVQRERARDGNEPSSKEVTNGTGSFVADALIE